MEIKDLMKAKQDILFGHLNILINHSTSKGEHCESAWIDFFRSFLPNKYAVDKGFVFDCEGNISEQIDIIIYDALYSPLVFGTDAGEKFITAESVYAVFESKSKISKENIKYAIKKIESVKSLHRTTRPIIVAGEYKKPRDLTHILGGILGIKSGVTKETIETYSKKINDFDCIDFGCIINDFTFQITRDENENIKTIFSSKEEIIISFFYLLLDELYKLGTVSAIDIREYANHGLESIQLEISEEEKKILQNLQNDKDVI